MAEPQIIVSQEARTKVEVASPPDPVLAWSILSWAGVALALMAGGDILLAWVPPAFGNQDWLLSTMATSFNSLPLLVLGMTALLSGAVGRGDPRFVLVASVAVTVAGLAILALTLGFWTQLPAAFEALAGGNPEIGPAFRRAVIRMSVFGTVFGVTLLGAGAFAYRRRGLAEGA